MVARCFFRHTCSWKWNSWIFQRKSLLMQTNTCILVEFLQCASVDCCLLTVASLRLSMLFMIIAIIKIQNYMQTSFWLLDGQSFAGMNKFPSFIFSRMSWLEKLSVWIQSSDEIAWKAFQYFLKELDNRHWLLKWHDEEKAMRWQFHMSLVIDHWTAK